MDRLQIYVGMYCLIVIDITTNEIAAIDDDWELISAWVDYRNVRYRAAEGPYDGIDA